MASMRPIIFDFEGAVADRLTPRAEAMAGLDFTREHLLKEKETARREGNAANILMAEDMIAAVEDGIRKVAMSANKASADEEARVAHRNAASILRQQQQQQQQQQRPPPPQAAPMQSDIRDVSMSENGTEGAISQPSAVASTEAVQNQGREAVQRGFHEFMGVIVDLARDRARTTSTTINLTSREDLAQIIFALQETNDQAMVCMKKALEGMSELRQQALSWLPNVADAQIAPFCVKFGSEVSALAIQLETELAIVASGGASLAAIQVAIAGLSKKVQDGNFLLLGHIDEVDLPDDDEIEG